MLQAAVQACRPSFEYADERASSALCAHDINEAQLVWPLARNRYQPWEVFRMAITEVQRLRGMWDGKAGQREGGASQVGGPRWCSLHC